MDFGKWEESINKSDSNEINSDTPTNKDIIGDGEDTSSFSETKSFLERISHIDGDVIRVLSKSKKSIMVFKIIKAVIDGIPLTLYIKNNGFPEIFSEEGKEFDRFTQEYAFETDDAYGVNPNNVVSKTKMSKVQEQEYANKLETSVIYFLDNIKKRNKQKKDDDLKKQEIPQERNEEKNIEEITRKEKEEKEKNKKILEKERYIDAKKLLMKQIRSQVFPPDKKIEITHVSSNGKIEGTCLSCMENGFLDDQEKFINGEDVSLRCYKCDNEEKFENIDLNKEAENAREKYPKEGFPLEEEQIKSIVCYRSPFLEEYEVEADDNHRNGFWVREKKTGKYFILAYFEYSLGDDSDYDYHHNVNYDKNGVFIFETEESFNKDLFPVEIDVHDYSKTENILKDNSISIEEAIEKYEFIEKIDK